MTKRDACWYTTVTFSFSASINRKNNVPEGATPLGTQQNPAETELYYVTSRYYNPEMGRFICADGYATTYNSAAGANMFAYCLNNPIALADTDGEFGWFVIANATIGAVVGAVSQIATNVLSGNGDYLAGVVGAAIGGAVYNVVALTTGSLLAASAAGTAAEAITNEICDYATQKKEVTKENLLSSATNVVKNTATNTLVSVATGKAASKVVKTNSGWFKPKKFVSSFTGKYAKKIWGQTSVQGAMTAAVNTTKNMAYELFVNRRERDAATIS